MASDTGHGARLMRRLATLAVILGAEASAAKAQEMRETPGLSIQQSSVTSEPLTLSSTIGDLLSHPQLAPFARRILPWVDRPYDDTMPLADIARLLPYHSAVDPDEVVDGINHIIAARLSQTPVFHEIYTEAERSQNPHLSAAGLFFFPGRPGAPFAMIAPGGGFSYVGSVHEGFPHAIRLSQLGYNAFVVTYRTGQGAQVATQDMARAIDHVLGSAAQLRVSPEGYSVWGSSAGARMAAFIGTHGLRAFGAGSDLRPAAVIMAYTGHSDVGQANPPTYAIIGSDDPIASPAAMKARDNALRKQGVTTRLRVVDGGAHGFGTGLGTPAAGWVDEAAEFWRRTVSSGRR